MPSMVQEMQEMQDFAQFNGYADTAWTVQNSVPLCQ